MSLLKMIIMLVDDYDIKAAEITTDREALKKNNVVPNLNCYMTRE